MSVKRLIERVFPTTERRMPLERMPLGQLPGGHWLETPDLIAALLAPGQLEVNLLPFEFISTRFQPGTASLRLTLTSSFLTARNLVALM